MNKQSECCLQAGSTCQQAGAIPNPACTRLIAARNNGVAPRQCRSAISIWPNTPACLSILGACATWNRSRGPRRRRARYRTMRSRRLAADKRIDGRTHVERRARTCACKWAAQRFRVPPPPPTSGKRHKRTYSRPANAPRASKFKRQF